MSLATSSSRPGASPLPRINGPNTQTKILDTVHGRILCIADVRGRLSSLNQLAKEHNALAIVHTGDFGFYDLSSLDRINDRTLRHLLMYSPLISASQRDQLLASDSTPASQRQTLHDSGLELLTEFPKLLEGKLKLSVPVFTVCGACEDVNILEKFRMGTYEVENLHILDEATTRCLDVGGVKLRLLGIGGALVLHKLFDNGDGNATIAGGGGTMWVTALQIGELVDTAQRVYDPTETRLLVTHASPGRDGLMAQLALVTKADLTISGGLHFRYATSYNEFSVQGDADGYRGKILRGKDQVEKVWETVKGQVEGIVDDQQRILLEKFLSVLERVPPAPTQGAGQQPATEEPSWKNCWNWNLCDAAYGALLLDIKEGRVSAELRSQGFNYAYRRTGTANTVASSSATNATPQSQRSALTAASPAPGGSVSATSTPTKANEPRSAVDSTSASPIVQVGGKDAQANGHAERSEKEKERAEQKKKERKEKEKERRERQKAEREKEKQEKGTAETPTSAAPASASTPAGPAPTDAPRGPTPRGSGKATPIHSGSGTPGGGSISIPAGESALSSAANPISPISPAGSSGARTPTSRKAPRNPWTLFMKLPAPTTEEELREFFQDAKSGITKINFPSTFGGRGRTAFIEFGDEESMKKGLEGHAEKLKDQIVNVSIAEDRPPGAGRGGHGPRGRGGFVSRGFAAAGLTRDRKPSQGGGKPDSPAPAPAASSDA